MAGKDTLHSPKEKKNHKGKEDSHCLASQTLNASNMLLAGKDFELLLFIWGVGSLFSTFPIENTFNNKNKSKIR